MKGNRCLRLATWLPLPDRLQLSDLTVSGGGRQNLLATTTIPGPSGALGPAGGRGKTVKELQFHKCRFLLKVTGSSLEATNRAADEVWIQSRGFP
jgi:hypothetical protein